VVAGEVFPGETARLEDGHGQGIAHDQHGGGAGGGGEVEGTGFARDTRTSSVTSLTRAREDLAAPVRAMMRIENV
jgi:hypothetical protein